MASDNPTLNGLAADDRRFVESLLMGFDLEWRDGLLAERVGRLLPPGHPARLPALIELVKIDLERQWQAGKRVGIDAYLKTFPELGTSENAPPALIRAEYEARRRAGDGVTLTQYARRYPKQAAEVCRLVEETADTSVRDARPRPIPATLSNLPPEPSESSTSDLPSATGPLPDRFGRYEIRSKLGEGGMGAVYLAYDTSLNRQVALKTPNLDCRDPDVLHRFLREARAAAILNHPNICPVYDVGEVAGRPYLALAFIEGRPLSALIRPDAPLDPRKAARLAARIALGLRDAHDHGIVHRDLKPANVMVNRRGEPVVMDFGLVRLLNAGEDHHQLTQPGMMLGTPAYMAPEQISGELSKIGPATDIYALGVIVFEMLTGVRPFQGPTLYALYDRILNADRVPPSSLRPGLDPKLDAICLRALAKAPAERFTSMAELSAALVDYLRTTEAVSNAPVPGASAPASPAASPEAWLASIAGAPGKPDPIPADSAILARSARSSRSPRHGLAVILAAVLAVGVLGVLIAVLVLSRRPAASEGSHAGGIASPEPAKRGADDRSNRPVAVARQAAAPSPDPGFVPLFNGKDLTGWKVDRGDPGAWRVEDGHLIGTGADDYRRQTFLLSETNYSDFLLRFEFWSLGQFDSGIAIRAEPGETPSPPEVNLRYVRDDPPGLHAQTGAFRWSKSGRGEDYRGPVRTDLLRPAPVWNEMSIAARGRSVRVTLNGQIVQDLDLDQLSNRPDALSSLQRRSGRVGFQSHTGTVRFRNIEIRELPPEADPDFRLGTPVAGSGRATPPSLVGSWRGSLTLDDGQTLRLIFRIKQPRSNGALIAFLDSIDQKGGNDVPVTSILLENGKVSFGLSSIGGQFLGTLDATSGVLKGEWLQNGVRWPLVLEKF